MPPQLLFVWRCPWPRRHCFGPSSAPTAPLCAAALGLKEAMYAEARPELEEWAAVRLP